MRQLLSILVLCLLGLSAPLTAQEGAPPSAAAAAPQEPSAEEQGWEEWIDAKFKVALDEFNSYPFYNILKWFGDEEEPLADETGAPVAGPTGGDVVIKLPFVVVWLIIGAVFFTFRMRFVNLRMFKHAIRVTMGRYDDPNDQGEVTHFQALSSALSATVGLGNIAGVAIAVSLGGPGATFWMIVAGFLGMTLKFTECTLGQMYRTIDEDGRVSGGPMHYLKHSMPVGGSLLAVVFTVFCIGGSLAGGNAFQVFQSKAVLSQNIPIFGEHGWLYGVIMAALVGIVIIGGIRRIAVTASRIVPLMCSVYVICSIAILVYKFDAVPAAFGAIFSNAFSGEAMYGGAIGAIIMGFKRAAFSNEAGVGSASIAHSAAKTPYPAREGIVALLEPFIDTIVVCTMTALVIVVTGVYQPAAGHVDLIAANEGATLTMKAWDTVPFLQGWATWLLLSAVVLFAFSTMISWSYYGERCWTLLFGKRSSIVYKILFLTFVVLGSIMSGTSALEFGDSMILCMALPNILGLYFLGGKVKAELAEYERKLASGEIRPHS